MSKPILQVDNFQGWQVGQKCQVAELNGVWVIDYIHIFDHKGPHEFEQVHVTKLKKDGSRNKYNATIRADKLLALDEKQPDKDRNNLTAAEYAKQIFSSGFAKHDYYNTTRESLVKVLSISKAGRVKIDRITIKKGVAPRSKKVEGRKVYDQETYLLNLASLEYDLCHDEKTYIPSLHDGKWKFWNGSTLIEEPTIKMTWLLD